MIWNWQKPDWPKFRWDAAQVAELEQRFLVGSGVLMGTVSHLGEDEQMQLLVEAMGTEAVTTSAIEGEILNRVSVQSSIRRQLGLTADKLRVMPAEQGIAEMMVDLWRAWAKPASNEMLFRWHRMAMRGRRDIGVGRYRTGSEPMQVVSGATGRPKIHFEAPPSRRVVAEMKRFLAWFNRTVPEGPEPLPALVRAGIAHLYFESIHPFEDGNGRLGRALSETAIAQSLGQPVVAGLATVILARRKSYYDALERANKSNEITGWVEWFAEVAVEAQRRTISQVEFVIAKTRLLDRLRGGINERQQKALLRMFREGPEGFKGGLSAGKYSTITGASPATATRDLVDLMEKGALVRTGELKHARYLLNPI